MSEVRLIDANELITRIESYIERKAITEKDAKIFELICGLIDTAPTVDSPTYTDIVEANKEGYNTAKRLYERPQGEWIDHWDKGYVECPFCHKQITGGDLNFCVKCGADMRKGGEK